MSKRTVRFGILSCACLLVVASGCSDDSETEVPLAEGIYAPLGEVRPDATPEQREAFERGMQVALRRFRPSEGLGPTFNLVFCGGCHEKPVTGGSGPRYRNFLLTGQQLSDGSFVGTGINGVQVFYDPTGEVRMPTDADTNVTATRNPIPFFGIGLLAELPDTSILVHADPDDLDGDGISGRPNFDRGFVGRFGRKSQTVSIEGFIRGPLFNHMGITSNPLSDALKDALPVPSGSGSLRQGLSDRGFGQSIRGQAAAPDEPTEDDDGVPDPELSEQDLFDLISFSMLLAAPQAEALTDETRAGARHFAEVGCEGCHVPSLVGPRGRIPLYSDLLLHDMGESMSDGIQMKLASGSEFRTQPLWGVAATGPYLHDGRADTLHDAIVWHGGEAQASKDAYLALSGEAQQQLQAFLLSLGGRDQMTEGLIPPDAPVPSSNEAGGPEAGTDLTRFEAGRRVFDRDVPAVDGLGPIFNGDSCRACHFEPAVGGAGPNGVNVIRHGFMAMDGTFTAAPEGTIAHRLALASTVRPPISEGVNLFELRQTPSVFGLGRLEAVPEGAIVALEDPTDNDGDGIRGVAHRLPDGRLGRFGWRADVPNLAEFARDAMGAELGVTVPAQDGLTYGAQGDGDGTADPEISLDELQALVFYLSTVAAPSPSSTDPDAEMRGAAVFETVGCDGCHVPELPDGQGGTVRAYTDLLLHEVQVPGYVGVPSFAASGAQFRTAPLWGVGSTAPYWHDGQAETLEEAIARHEGEAETSRMAYEQATADERADLLAFLRSL